MTATFTPWMSLQLVGRCWTLASLLREAPVEDTVRRVLTAAIAATSSRAINEPGWFTDVAHRRPKLKSQRDLL